MPDRAPAHARSFRAMAVLSRMLRTYRSISAPCHTLCDIKRNYMAIRLKRETCYCPITRQRADPICQI